MKAPTTYGIYKQTKDGGKWPNQIKQTFTYKEQSSGYKRGRIKEGRRDMPKGINSRWVTNGN